MATLRVGVIGAGYFGRHYVRLLHATKGIELAGVAVRATTEMIDIPDDAVRYGSADELLQDQKIDCVVIVTPPSTHAELAVKALENGKHVLLEKPMALSIAEAHTIERAIKKSSRIFMVGHQYCYNDSVRELKKEIEKGTLGEVKYVFAEHLYAGPVRLDVGCLWETATHELSIIDYLFPNARVTKISGQMLDMAGSGRDDLATAVLRFDTKMLATIFTTWFAPQKVRRMIIGGTQGMACFNEKEKNPLVFTRHPYPSGESPELHTSHFFEITEKETYIPDIEAHEPLANQLDHFFECIREQKMPLTGIEQGLRITKLLEEITTGIWV